MVPRGTKSPSEMVPQGTILLGVPNHHDTTVDAKEDNPIQLGARKQSIFCKRVVRTTGAMYYICLGSYHIPAYILQYSRVHERWIHRTYLRLLYMKKDAKMALSIKSGMTMVIPVAPLPTALYYGQNLALPVFSPREFRTVCTCRIIT